MLITRMLEKNAEEFPEDIALVEINPDSKNTKHVTWKEFELIEPTHSEYYRREISWEVFNEKANRFANMLLNHGIKKGKKVAILLNNCLEWLPIYFGILKSGALAVPLNFRYTSEEIEYCLNKAEADMLVFGPNFIGRVEEIANNILPQCAMVYFGEGIVPSFADDYRELTANESGKNPNIKLTLDDDAAIYFSSGTTGFPKAILHKHRSLTHSAKVEQKHHGQTKDDVFLCIPPLYHTGAKMHWFGSLISGSKAVLLKGIKPEYILNTVSVEKCTIVWLLVPWAQDILNAIESGEVNLKEYELSQWRLMHIGAQPVPPSLIKKWKEYFPNHQYDTNYGLSESIGPGCVHLGVENTDKIGAIGKAGFGWQTKIVDKNFNEVKQGEIGELLVKGPGVMVCYYNDPDSTKEVLHDGWLSTGDVAKEDKDGFIRLVDRAKDVIISGGENIYPVQIENFLREYPDVSDAAVIGLPDKRLGEITCAIIEAKKGRKIKEGEIESFCKDLPRYKRPRKIIFAKIPRNPTGKIEKPKLRQKYGATMIVDLQNLS